MMIDSTYAAVFKAACAGITHRPAPTVVIFLVLAADSAAALLGLAPAADSSTLFMAAFAVVVLVMAVRITASVVAAAVLAGHRRIAVLRSAGFTPAQVTATYLIQIGLPALAGAIAGTALGDQVVLPLISAGHLLFATDVTAPLWASLVVPSGMLALTGLAAAVPALRAGRQPVLPGAGG